jgi:hypothetical protein
MRSRKFNVNRKTNRRTMKMKKRKQIKRVRNRRRSKRLYGGSQIPYTKMVQAPVAFSRNRVIGKKGQTIRSLQQQFGCTITANKPNPSQGLPDPYFLIQGNEQQVNLAEEKILLILSKSK